MNSIAAKGFYELSGEAAERLPESAMIDELQSKFREIEVILNNAANLPADIRADISDSLRTNIARRDRREVINNRNTWLAALDVLIFTYDTIRDRLYTLKSARLLNMLNEVVRMRFRVLADEYQRNAIKDEVLKAEELIEISSQRLDVRMAESSQSMVKLAASKKI